MKMVKGVVLLSVVAMLALCALNSAAASSMSTSQPRSDSPTYYFTKFTYPTQVSVGRNFYVTGTLMNGTKGEPNATIYHGEWIEGELNPTMWKVQTDQNGSFKDTFHFSKQGQHDLIYIYRWGSGMNYVCLSEEITIYAVSN